MRIFLVALITLLSFHPLLAQQVKDIAFTIIEKPPVYPNCKGANADNLKECFRNKVEQVIEKNLDFAQFETVLPKGLHRVFVSFTIDEEGLITKLHVRTPYLSVQKKTEEALANIPVLEPGIHKEKVRATAFATAFSIDVKQGKEFVKDTSTAARMRPRYSKNGY